MGPDGEKFDEVYVLSLPAFRWFSANSTSTSPRWAHTCHATTTRQMIMIGGTNPLYSFDYDANGDRGGEPQDPWEQGIAVFDMNTLKFKNSFQSRADPYEPPLVIQQYYNNRLVYHSCLKGFKIHLAWMLIRFQQEQISIIMDIFGGQSDFWGQTPSGSPEHDENHRILNSICQPNFGFPSISFSSWPWRTCWSNRRVHYSSSSQRGLDHIHDQEKEKPKEEKPRNFRLWCSNASRCS